MQLTHSSPRAVIIAGSDCWALIRIHRHLSASILSSGRQQRRQVSLYQRVGGQVASSVLRHAPPPLQLSAAAAAAAAAAGGRPGRRRPGPRRPPPQLVGGRLLAQAQPPQGRPLPRRPPGEAHLGGELRRPRPQGLGPHGHWLARRQQRVPVLQERQEEQVNIQIATFFDGFLSTFFILLFSLIKNS